MINIRKLEAELWESADLLRAGSKLTSNQYCMPVLGLIFLRYAYSRFKMVEAEIQKNRPSRGGRVLPVEASDFAEKSALYLPKEAQYEYLVNLPDNISAAQITNSSGQVMNSLGEVVNHAMELVEAQSEQLSGVLPKDYTMFSDDLLRELLRIFNNSALDDVGGDIVGRIYEYFLNKFAKNIAQERIAALLFSNPQRIDYYERYQAIIQDYNNEQNRAAIEKTFMELMALAKSLDEEEQRYVREEFANDEELSIYDLLYKEGLTKQEIKKLKEVSASLLQKIKQKISELDHWTDKDETKSAVKNMIRDMLWTELPESYSDESIDEYRQKIFEYVIVRYQDIA